MKKWLRRSPRKRPQAASASPASEGEAEAQRRAGADESDPGARREGTAGSNDQDAGSVGGERVEIRMDAQPSSIKSSSTTPPSGNATAEGGYGRLNSSLRSVLFHPVGLPLFRFFNDDHDLNVYSKDYLAQFPSYGGGRSDFDGVLREGYEAYQTKVNEYAEEKRKDPNHAISKPSEETLTGILHKGIASKLTPELKACHQLGLKYNPTSLSQARTGLLIRRNDDEDKRGIVLLLEVAWGGADAELWWKKADQNAQYLELFQHPMNKDAASKFSGPLLFAVLTMDKEEAKLDDPTRESAQLGVYLCAPRPPVANDADAKAGLRPGYRAALLWRDTFHTLEGASKGMGKTLRATVALAQMLTDPGRRVSREFTFLGPNCCRVGNKVLRAYDSRFRRTDRRPDLYGDPDIAPGARVLCRIVDRKMAVKLPPHDEWLAFQLWDRRARVYEPTMKRQWLWDFGGELLVIETAFHKGPHYALSPKDFIPVVEFLQTIHEKGYVHGDIRCANIVFGKCLIDFDLGGRVEDAPSYPDGYEQDLVDGSRRGSSGQKITKSDDWYAMLRAIFVVHKLYPPAPPSDSDLKLTFSRDGFIRLTEPSTAVPGTGALDDSMIQNLASDLIKFLRNVDSWTVSASERFLSLVVLWGVPEQQQDPRETSHPATGSPPEKR